MVTLTCQCCGFEASFADAEEAFRAGWDAPPLFSQVTCCNLCPASFIVMGQASRHDKIHKLWDSHGRPAEFSLSTCVSPEDWPGAD
jgi:hypothetical protein